MNVQCLTHYCKLICKLNSFEMCFTTQTYFLISCKEKKMKSLKKTANKHTISLFASEVNSIMLVHFKNILIKNKIQKI